MDDQPIETAANLFREIKKRGLELRKDNGRDDALYKDLVNELNAPNHRLQVFLDSSDLSSEEFLKAFIKITQPFSKMFSEIWAYLSDIYAPKALESISIRFGKKNDKDVYELDLEKFRRSVEKTKKVDFLIQQEIWPIKVLEKLLEIRKIISVPANVSIESDAHYKPSGYYNVPKPNVSSLPFNTELRKISNQLQLVVNESINFQKKSENELNFPAKEYSHLLFDLLPGWNPILRQPEIISKSQKQKALDYYNQEIAPLLEEQTLKKEINIQEYLDILDLPFWRKRWHTYEIWSTVLTLQSLEDYKPELKIQDGYLALDGYSDEIIADLSAQNYENACVRIQAQTPFVKYGKKGIKPDLRICYSEKLTKSNTAAIVEFKQHKKINEKSFKEIARNYIEGSPKAGGVVIINYDSANISKSLRSNCYLLEGVQPNNFNSISYFESTLDDILQRANFLPKNNKIVLLDISSSMGDSYNKDKVKKNIKSIAEMKGVQLLQFNDKLIQPNDSDITDLFPVNTSGGTNLKKALEKIAELFDLPAKLLIVTDSGYSEPKLLDEIDSIECIPSKIDDHIDWLMN